MFISPCSNILNTIVFFFFLSNSGLLLAWEWLSLSKMHLPYPFMVLLPGTNKPVFLCKVSTRCFWALLNFPVFDAPVPTCLKHFAGVISEQACSYKNLQSWLGKMFFCSIFELNSIQHFWCGGWKSQWKQLTWLWW